ncbi:hypothetical protein E2C01_054964 [Portunus trituberculatus]|uniref:Uncharacterized protein n=1 Tax=Portunus trituberculatus TaxID=210409 RepID=A0A5B7GTF6_PORTR|nr:hypothetical protein [Portunus trituberculatus]
MDAISWQEVALTLLKNLGSSSWCWYWLPLSHSLSLRSTKRLTCISAPLNNSRNSTHHGPLVTFPWVSPQWCLCGPGGDRSHEGHFLSLPLPHHWPLPWPSVGWYGAGSPGQALMPHPLCSQTGNPIQSSSNKALYTVILHALVTLLLQLVQVGRDHPVDHPATPQSSDITQLATYSHSKHNTLPFTIPSNPIPVFQYLTPHSHSSPQKHFIHGGLGSPITGNLKFYLLLLKFKEHCFKLGHFSSWQDVRKFSSNILVKLSIWNVCLEPLCYGIHITAFLLDNDEAVASTWMGHREGRHQLCTRVT